MSDQAMDDMPQMPETTGFLQIFREMLGFDLIGEEWGLGLSGAAIAAIVVGSAAAVGTGAALGAAYYNYTHEDGVVRRALAYFQHEDTIWERVKKAVGKED